jgi:hypothetical protein
LIGKDALKIELPELDFELAADSSGTYPLASASSGTYPLASAWPWTP